MAACYSKDTILAKLNDVELDLCIVLKEKQRETILNFALGNDVFCCLPTGYGKSLCYALLPKLYDKLRATSSSSIVICISPLVALMEDQYGKFTKMGLSCTFLSQFHQQHVDEIRQGAVQLIFVTPELLLNNFQWRELLLSDVYTSNLVCIAVDEAHCVTKW